MSAATKHFGVRDCVRYAAMRCQLYGSLEDPVSPRSSECAMQFSYAQAILSAIYGSTTGGMFVIGYALKLGATNAQIGLLSTVPMFCVVVQLLASRLVEHGISRRRLAIATSTLSVAGWSLVAMLPAYTIGASCHTRIVALLGVLVIITLFGQVASNARASWVADIIPPRVRGNFFGRMTMYAGIVGAAFAVIGGAFLDHVKHAGLSAFTWVFLFGMACGLLSTLLFVPQVDVPATRTRATERFARMVRATFRNRALMVVMLYAVVWSLQNIAAPFYPTYLLRDLRMSYLGFSLVSVVGTILVLVSSPFWGRVVDRYGCRPVLIACTLAVAPLPLVWTVLNTAHRVYIAIPITNLIGGLATGGISVALTTLIYKVIPDSGRSVQLAVYSIGVLLLAAPMPTIGGHLPDWLRSMGIGADLRSTFYASIPFALAAALVARHITEPDACGTIELARTVARHLRRQA